MKNGERANLLVALHGYMLPVWKGHIQPPPPNHVLRPDGIGISKANLVFPFFLFYKGAAIPIHNILSAGAIVAKR